MVNPKRAFMDEVSRSADTATGEGKPDLGANGAKFGFETGIIAGERNLDSSTNSYLVAHGESNYSVVDEADGTAIAVSGGAPAFLEGVYINEVLAGATIILEDGAGSAVITIPAGGEADVGSQLTFPSIRFNTSIVCNCEAGLSTGNITIQWRPIG